MNPPDGALVADAWLRVVAGLPASCIGPSLPTARRTPAPDWVTQVFVQHTIVGGAPGVELPIRRPVIQLDFWAVTLDDRTPPWGRASAVAEKVWEATHIGAHQLTLAVPAGYQAPQLREVRALQEPRKVPGDDAGFARFQFDAEFVWAPSAFTSV